MFPLRLPTLTSSLALSASLSTWIRRLLVVALAYYASGRLGLAVPQLGSHISLIWPPTGIALAALLRWGPNVWPGVWLGAFTVALSVNSPVWLAFALACGNAAGPAAAAWVLQRLGLHSQLDRRRDLWLYISIGACAGMCITATSGAFWLWVAGFVGATDIFSAWTYWWLGDAIGALIVGVPLLTYSAAHMAWLARDWRWASTLLLSLTTVAAGWLAFAMPAAGGGAHLTPLVFVPHLLLGWLAARSGIFVASLSALLLSAGGVWATARGHGPFVASDTASSLMLLWGYVGTLTAMPLMVTALIGEMAMLEARWQGAMNDSDIGVGEWDSRRRRFTFSRRWLTLLGHRTQSFGDTATAVWSRVHEDDRDGLRQAFESLDDAAVGIPKLTGRMLRNDGTWAWFTGTATVVERAQDGQALRVLVTALDIDAQRVAEERHRLSSTLFHHLHEGLLITDAVYRVLDANPAFSRITGYSLDEIRGTVPPLLRPAAPGSPSAVMQVAVLDSLRASGSWRGEMTDTRRNGDACVLQVTISAVKGSAGEVRFHAVALSDITAAHQQRARLERQAHCDELTGLPNRTQLAHMLRDAMALTDRDGTLLTVCYLDLDHFKPINDRFGHEAGDRLLIELAERLRRSARGGVGLPDAVARLGGDEFALLIRTATLDESRHAVERVLASVSQPYGLGLGTGPLTVTASIGATVYPLDRADADTLIRHADHAMYGAKQSGRNGHLLFDAESDRRANQRFEALGRVQEALNAQEFALYYQPKVDMRLGKVLGFEALLRWKHPQHGVITPANFLPLIEHTGLSVGVGDWVLQQGLEQLARWQRGGLDITLSVNISARHLQEPNFAQRLAALLERHSSPVAQRLIIEVLETAALADIDYTCSLMQECRALGVRFALDDFGTGYSTLTYLKRLPLDMLKIDRSFVRNMLSDHQDLAIVEGVIGLSKTFGCTVVAEGVESADQASCLIEMGCHVGQGNGIAKAMPVDEVLTWMKSYESTAQPAWTTTA